jgi:hypothetical protein
MKPEDDHSELVLTGVYKEENRVDVLLLAPHTHLCEKKRTGEVINVTQTQCQWLLDRGIARVITITTRE